MNTSTTVQNSSDLERAKFSGDSVVLLEICIDKESGQQGLAAEILTEQLLHGYNLGEYVRFVRSWDLVYNKETIPCLEQIAPAIYSNFTKLLTKRLKAEEYPLMGEILVLIFKKGFLPSKYIVDIHIRRTR